MTTQIVYRKDDVWLCEYAGITKLVIKEIRGGYVRHQYAWATAQNWHAMAKVKVGTVRRILGIPFGVRSL